MSRSQVREGFHVPIRTYSYQWYLRAHVSYDHIICPGNTPAIIWYNVRIVTGICTRYAIWYVKILVLNVTGMEGHVCCLYQAQMKQRRLPVLPTPDAVRQPDSVRQGRAHKLSWMISRSLSPKLCWMISWMLRDASYQVVGVHTLWRQEHRWYWWHQRLSRAFRASSHV